MLIKVFYLKFIWLDGLSQFFSNCWGLLFCFICLLLFFCDTQNCSYFFFTIHCLNILTISFYLFKCVVFFFHLYLNLINIFVFFSIFYLPNFAITSNTLLILHLGHLQNMYNTTLQHTMLITNVQWLKLHNV